MEDGKCGKDGEKDVIVNNDFVDAIGTILNSKPSLQPKAPYVPPKAIYAPPPSLSSQKPVSIANENKYYDTTNANRGVALIFNHFKFVNSKLSARNGTNKDRDDIGNILKILKFDVRVHNDLKYVQIMKVIDKVAREDHTKNDCIVIVVMTHGDDNILYASDASYPVSELWNSFVGNNCKSLIGKPKMVFIQACRGDKFDSGAKYKGTGDWHDTVILPNKVEYYIPKMADLLVMFSTFEGHYSWRNPDHGSWFIQSLCDELLENGNTDDVLTILTGVSRRVAYQYQSNVPGVHYMDCMKQMPSITSMLTKILFFTEKHK